MIETTNKAFFHLSLLPMPMTKHYENVYKKCPKLKVVISSHDRAASNIFMRPCSPQRQALLHLHGQTLSYFYKFYREVCLWKERQNNLG